jgi:hypothetical protein
MTNFIKDYGYEIWRKSISEEDIRLADISNPFVEPEVYCEFTAFILDPVHHTLCIENPL